MINIRLMTLEDLTIFKKWLYTPHVAKWYHEPLDWIAEIEQQEGAYNWIHHYIVEYNNRQIGFCQYYAVTACRISCDCRRYLSYICRIAIFQHRYGSPAQICTVCIYMKNTPHGPLLFHNLPLPCFDAFLYFKSYQNACSFSMIKNLVSNGNFCFF